MSYDAADGGRIYTIDRWRTWGKVDVNYGYITNTIINQYYRIEQGINPDIWDRILGKTVTFCARVRGIAGDYVKVLFFGDDANQLGSGYYALKTSDWETVVLTIDVSANRPSRFLDLFFYTSDKDGGGTLDIEWVALYEGEYTIDTLPEYQPKGYGAELVECQRYFERKNIALYAINQGDLLWSVDFLRKRIIPTIT